MTRVCTSEDQLHTQIFDSREKPSKQFQLVGKVPMFLKLKLKDKLAPVLIYFQGLNDDFKTSDVFWSRYHLEPNRESN